jgi:hypothetical protein
MLGDLLVCAAVEERQRHDGASRVSEQLELVVQQHLVKLRVGRGGLLHNRADASL